MEYRMFGPAGFPDDSFRKGLQTLLAANKQDWEGISNWFLTTDTFEPDEAVSSPSLLASSLAPDQIIESVEVLEVELEHVQRDLILLGLSSETIDRLSVLLQRTGSVRDRAYAHYC
jgi:hypothetical protein